MQKIISFSFFIFLTTHLFAQFPEGFEGDVFPPEGWLVSDNGNGDTFAWQTTDDAFIGSSAAFLRWEDVADGLAEDWLISPQFMPTAEKHILSFFQKKDYANEYGTVYTIRVSTNSQDNFDDFTIVDTQHEDDLELNYASHEVDLSEYIGQNIYVAFVMTNDDGDNWSIDEVNLPACAAPAELFVDNITAFGASLGWVDGSASFWSVEVVASGVPPTGNPTFEGVNTTSVYWSDGVPLTAYDFYVRADCGDGSVSNWGGPYSFVTGCSEETCAYQLILTDTYGDNWNGAYIEVRQNGVSMASFTQSGGGFDPQVFEFNFCNGADFELVWHGGSWDQECIFEFYDPWEQLYHSFGAFQAPENGVFFSYTASCDPISCRFPFDLAATNYTTNGAELSWVEADDATVWDIEVVTYGSDFTGTPTVSGVSSNPYVWEGGAPGTYYSFRVRAHCDDGNFSDWTIFPYTFSTLCDYTESVFPYDENFDADLFLPNCWTSTLKGEGGNQWHAKVDTYLDEMVVNCKNERKDQDVWLASPEFDFTAMPNNPVLSFDWKMSYYWMTYPYNKGDLNLRISTDGGNSWSNPVWSEDEAGAYTSFVWQHTEIDLAAYAGETSVRFAFQYIGNDASTVYLDHFNLKEPTGLVDTKEPSLLESGITNIYPVPAGSFITIEYNNQRVLPVSVLLTDIVGRDLINISGAQLEGQNAYTLDISNLISGIYFVQLKIGNHLEVRKIVKY